VGYPKYMNDEELAAFGFVPTDEDPSLAKHFIYPTLTVRYHCPSCKLWASTMKGGRVLVCEQCHKGGRPIKTGGQFKKVYACCQNSKCETWQKLLALLSDAGVCFENCHDGFGGYVELLFPTTWSLQDRINMHWKINDYCVSKHGARKVDCKKTGRLRSKVPGSTRS